MSLGDADHGEMHLFRRRLRAELLDDPTAERLLRGQVDPDDAPPGYGGVAEVLRAAAAEPVVTDSSAEDQAVAAFAATAWVRDAGPVEPKRRFVVPITSKRNKVAAVAASLGLVLTGGLSAAGALPAPPRMSPTTYWGRWASRFRTRTPTPGTIPTPAATTPTLRASRPRCPRSLARPRRPAWTRVPRSRPWPARVRAEQEPNRTLPPPVRPARSRRIPPRRFPRPWVRPARSRRIPPRRFPRPRVRPARSRRIPPRRYPRPGPPSSVPPHPTPPVSTTGGPS